MNVKKQRFLAVLALILAVCMMVSACSKKSEPKQDSSTAEETSSESAEESSEEAVEGSSEEPEETNTPIDVNVNGMFEKVSSAPGAGESLEITGSKQLFGELSDKLENYEPVSLTADQFAEMDRAMRAYTPGDETPIINATDYYYYYEHLTPEQQDIYDSMYLLAMDPSSMNNIVAVNTTQDPYSDEFVQDYWVALYAIGDDHPEFWWINPANGGHSIVPYIRTENGKSVLMLQMDSAYENYEEDVLAFNAAVESFLADIDPEWTDEEKALAVHDKLINLATYNTPVLEKEEGDLAHTAYGAFVADSAGIANYCVCDGYSLAYEYCMQMLGIPCVVVRGRVEVPYPDGETGGHAWNLVQIDGIWYEMDSTWDDQTTFMDQVAEQYEPGSYEYQFFEEMTSDTAYMDLVQHCKYELMSTEIEDYVSPSYLTYTNADGAYFDPVGDSWRRRYCDYEETIDHPKGVLTALLPVADGTPAEETPEASESTEEPAEATSTDIVGVYYISQLDQMDEAALKAAYGNDYYERLPIIELRADGTGSMSKPDQTIEVTYTFSNDILILTGPDGGSLLFVHVDGKLTISNSDGTYMVFSKM